MWHLSLGKEPLCAAREASSSRGRQNRETRGRESERAGTERICWKEAFLLEGRGTTMETPSEQNQEQRQDERGTNESWQRARSASDCCVYWRCNLLLPALFVSTQESAASCPAGTVFTELLRVRLQGVIDAPVVDAPASSFLPSFCGFIPPFPWVSRSRFT